MDAKDLWTTICEFFAVVLARLSKARCFVQHTSTTQFRQIIELCVKIDVFFVPDTKLSTCVGLAACCREQIF